MPRTCWVVGALGLLGTACGVQRLDAGSMSDGTPASSDAGEAARERQLWPYGPPSNSFGLPCTMPAPPELAGTWTGQFDSYKLASGSSAIRIDVKGAYEQSDGLCGTVTFGEGTAPPIATDPQAPPPGEPARPDVSAISALLEGFPYEFAQPGRQHAVKTMGTDSGLLTFADAGLSSFPGAVDGDRVLFAITERQPFKSWCNLQSSYLVREPRRHRRGESASGRFQDELHSHHGARLRARRHQLPRHTQRHLRLRRVLRSGHVLRLARL